MILPHRRIHIGGGTKESLTETYHCSTITKIWVSKDYHAQR